MFNTRKLFDQTMGILERSLNLRSARQSVLTSNITNSNTPNYQSKDIPFQKMMKAYLGNSESVSLQKTHSRHFPNPGGAAADPDIELESSSGGVIIDLEMAKLAENNLMYQSAVQVLAKKLEGIKYILTEGGK